ncbi:MAG TPA: hypothetical protein VEC99_04575, partial [Clostridia bacterium]|nr:hypothetical protein [Clostridia bacterium]
MNPRTTSTVLLLTTTFLWSLTTLSRGESASPASASSPAAIVTADFGQLADYPLSKAKFGVYNSGWVRLSHYDRDIALFDEVKPHSVRIDLWWGKGPWSVPPVAGKPGEVRYYFAEIDHIAALLNAHSIRPCWAYCYIPPPLQAQPGDCRLVTTNARLWGE